MNILKTTRYMYNSNCLVRKLFIKTTPLLVNYGCASFSLTEGCFRPWSCSNQELLLTNKKYYGHYSRKRYGMEKGYVTVCHTGKCQIVYL